jgi:hypothetical protein
MGSRLRTLNNSDIILWALGFYSNAHAFMSGIYYYYDILLEEIHMSKRPEHGEVIARAGNSCIEIQLRGHPRDVDVRFKDQQDPVPCDPSNFDRLSYNIVKKGWFIERCYLVIFWEIYGHSRCIVWKTHF